MSNTIILQQELGEAAYNCRKALNKAQEAIRELHKLSDYPTPSTLADVTTSNLLAFVEQRVNAVKATPIYTQAQKDKTVSDWVEWRIKAMPFVVAIENFVIEWQEVSPVLDTATMTIYTSDIAEALTPRFTVEVPIQAHRHLELIDKVSKAVNELRDWEHEQDCKKIPLNKLLSFTDEEIKQSWANGTVKIDHSQDTPRLCAWRNAQDAAIL